MAPYNSWEEDQYQPERPDDKMHYRNYPARPALEALEELVAKFRNLDWIPMNYEGTWPAIVVEYYDGDEEILNAVSVCFTEYLFGLIADHSEAHKR